MQVRAAAIALAGKQFVVVATGMDLLQNPSEADLTIDTLQPHFGDVPVVLMALRDDDSPAYYGDQELLRGLAGLPVDQMPWKDYDIPA
jgi:hypothetical protein